jgi:serine/threonine-protein kinase
VALKSLHPENLGSSERRYRMQQEVHLLRLLAGNGVPCVLASNVEAWDTPGTPLYAIVEWVDGPTLADFCGGRPQEIDVALPIVTALIDIVRRCHAAGVLHRDIKPDNVILHGGDIARPVLIDFGMGWAASDESMFGEFSTGAGQELGNRFLRLPEYAPGHHVRDTRSDVTMLVAILFYLLTGAAPRVLLDPTGRMPHEAMLERFSIQSRADVRWERLRRVFNVGFQQRLDMRFVDAEQFAAALASLSSSVVEDKQDLLQGALRRIQELAQSPDGSLLDQGPTRVDRGAEVFLSALHRTRYSSMVRGRRTGTGDRRVGTRGKDDTLYQQAGCCHPKRGICSSDLIRKWLLSGLV